MKKLTLITLLILLMFSVVFCEDTKPSSFIFDRLSIGYEYSYNYGVKNNTNLYFPKEDVYFYSDLRGNVNNKLIILFELSDKLAIKIKNCRYEYISDVNLKPGFYDDMMTSMLMKIHQYSTEISLRIKILQISILSFNYFLGLSYNQIRYRFEYPLFDCGESYPESGDFWGGSYGFGISLLDSKIIGFHIQMINRDVFLKDRVENFNLFFEAGLTIKLNKIKSLFK